LTPPLNHVMNREPTLKKPVCPAARHHPESNNSKSSKRNYPRHEGPQAGKCKAPHLQDWRHPPSTALPPPASATGDLIFEPNSN